MFGWMWELDHKESWALKTWCFWTVLLEKTLESLLDCKEIKPVNPKGNQSWMFRGGTDAEAETPTLWPPDVKNWHHWQYWKRPWCWERLKAGEGKNRGWDSWMASQTRWTLVWASSGSWWWMWPWGSRNAGHDWVIELTTYLLNSIIQLSLTISILSAVSLVLFPD